MNQKRDEISAFLEKDLLPQVKKAFSEHQSADVISFEEKLKKTIKHAKEAGYDPEESPKIKELREKILSYGVDVESLENEVFSHLYNFFRRYYHEGDFLSLRRYKEGVYAIPYEGEEVKLYWANHDQYYIKSSEYLRDYAFKLLSGKPVHFKLMDADIEKDNVKAQNGKERQFILFEENSVEEIDGELVIRFEYRPDGEKRNQANLNKQAVETVLNQKGIEQWIKELSDLMPTEKNKYRTLLDGGFLRRELDFYIKNEVMHLDDIENETVPRVEQYLSKIKVIRKIGGKIIAFLEQLENFQKKLWLKKKFVVDTNYCVTLDRVSEELYEEIAANDAQREEWVKLFAINEIKGEIGAEGYSEPLIERFLKENKFLVVDTKFFGEDFKRKLLGSFEDLDGQCDGLLIHSENFQALNLLRERYRETVKCIYIDPPYNSKSSEIMYKNTFKHSSWLALMENRLYAARSVLANDGCVIIAIDENEQERLGMLLDYSFPSYEKSCISVLHNPAGVQGKNFSYTHESSFFVFPENGEFIGYTDRDEDLVSPLRDWGGTSARSLAKSCFYPIIVRNEAIVGFGEVCPDNFHPKKTNVKKDDSVFVYPIDKNGVERKWVFSRNSVEKNAKQLFVKVQDDEIVIMRRKSFRKYRTVWDDKRYYANIYGSKLLSNLFGVQPFSFPKSVYTVQDSIKAIATVKKSDSFILDYFGGSGTTGHAVININREDNGNRKYILVEMGDYFDTVLKPRIQKVIYSKDWKNGKPVSREGSSHMFKYICLESYEDTLNNLELKRTDKQEQLLLSDAMSKKAKEEYMLSYMLDVESKGSLLNINTFNDPFNYKLNIATGSVGETKPTKVDMVETFNYLIGLTVKHIDHIQGFCVVEGTNPKEEKVLIIWRNTKEKSNKALETFLRKQDYSTRDMEFDLIYVNGDNNLENIRRPDETWKVRLIEEEFKRLMFDVEDV
jgi:adenine-specific DNA-methyltransferase